MGVAFGGISGILYFKLTVPSEHELWRITDNNLEDPMVAGNLLLFKGHKGEYLHTWCEYIFAVDKTTGKTVWSDEEYTTDEYCNRSSGPVYTAIILLAKDNAILVSSTYWTADNDEQNFVLYALNHSTGELLWKVNGYAGYPYARSALLDYTVADANYIYVASKEGSFSAIDASNGKQVWKQTISSVDYTDNIYIESHDQVVYFYESGNNSITAFDTRDGNQIWKVSNLNYVEQILFSEQRIYITSSSYKDVGTKYPTVGNPPFDILALDTTTGEQTWKFTLGENFSPWADISDDQLYLLTHDSEGFGDNFKTLRRLIAVDKKTGEMIWQFNNNYPHGDINYLVQDRIVYVGTNDNFLFALDSETGKILWQVKDSGFPYYFHAEGNTLVVVYQEKYVSGFDIRTGKQKWTLDVGMDTNWYPDDFIIAGDGVIYVAGAINRTVYAIDIATGKILWTWNHYHPRDKAYMLKALENDVLYVDQYRQFLGYDWFFALKTNP